MKLSSTTVKTVIGATGIAAASVFAAATAVAAPPTMGGFGASEQLVDGPLITNYTVSNLEPSNVTIPGYMPKGQLYQANIAVQANSGTITPLVSDFNARAGNGGQQYRVIDTVPLPNGLSPAPILQGSQSTGTLYFDVTGAQPNQVVYNDGVQDVLLWS
ncbi:MAG TPA: MPT63 family protein [Mycobacterium sp.]|nr:MPT63 family protein [Mycobacterium sp.]